MAGSRASSSAATGDTGLSVFESGSRRRNEFVLEPIRRSCDDPGRGWDVPPADFLFSVPLRCASLRARRAHRRCPEAFALGGHNGHS